MSQSRVMRSQALQEVRGAVQLAGTANHRESVLVDFVQGDDPLVVACQLPWEHLLAEAWPACISLPPAPDFWVV